jgi:catalase (peroxidase I)
MKEQRARHILQALVQGIDPLTGEELASGTVLQHADVLRALLAGVAALEQTAARAQRRAQLPGNVGRSWSANEEATLVTAFKSGEPLMEIAAKHGRTLRAIEARLERMGLLTPEQRSTNNSFVTPATGGASRSQPP